MRLRLLNFHAWQESEFGIEPSPLKYQFDDDQHNMEKYHEEVYDCPFECSCYQPTLGLYLIRAV
jgi:hypothetical protein